MSTSAYRKYNSRSGLIIHVNRGLLNSIPSELFGYWLWHHPSSQAIVQFNGLLRKLNGLSILWMDSFHAPTSWWRRLPLVVVTPQGSVWRDCLLLQTRPGKVPLSVGCQSDSDRSWSALLLLLLGPHQTEHFLIWILDLLVTSSLPCTSL